jgi:Ricin-type beta-trefoil lectin domain-like
MRSSSAPTPYARRRRRTGALLTGAATAAGLTLVAAPPAAAAPPEIVSGDHYRITGGSSGLAVDVRSSSTAEDAVVVQREVDLESRSQAWRALRQPDGYELRNAHSGRCLSVAGDSVDAGAELVQRTCDDSAGQRWRVRAGDVDPTAGFESALSGDFIDVPGNTQDEDTLLELQPGNGDGGGPGASQSFYMVRVDV